MPLIACFDAAYSETASGLGVVLAEDWCAAQPIETHQIHVPGAPAEYEPGAFYKREAPLVRLGLERLSRRPEIILVDGYVWLSPKNEAGAAKPGLGGVLYEQLERRMIVVGVAKSAFRGDDWSFQLSRGGARPVFVTAAGMKLEAAAQAVARMHGAHRTPSLLKTADHAARAALEKGGA